jgi:hypothetical protein
MVPSSCCVYGLYSTQDGQVRYVGQTVQPLRDRLGQHLAEATRPPGASRCHRWIRKALRSGFKIGIQLIESDCAWDEAEKRWIAFYRRQYPGKMTNLSAGGAGYNGKRSLTTRLKMSKPKSPEHIERMRRPKTPEGRANIARGQIGNRKGVGERNGQATLTERDVIAIKDKLRDGASLSRIAAAHGVTKAAISKIKTGRTWRHLQQQAAHCAS